MTFVASATRSQWFQWTYAVLPNGETQNYGAGVVSTDDGTIWLFSALPNSFTLPLKREWWIGKVSPEGCERVFGNSWTIDPSLTLDGALEDGSAPNRFVQAGYDVFVPVENKIWMWNKYANERWFVFDTETMQYTWVAGSVPPASGETPLDHQDGKQARTSPQLSYAIHVGGYIYWFEESGRSTFNRNLMVLRRMSTEPPYGVETIRNGPTGTPVGFTGSTSTELDTWLHQVNPSTGLRNMYNADVAWAKGGYPAKLVYHDGYIYFGYMTEIRRIPLGGGPIETLLYGYIKPYDRNDAPTGTLFRDHESDYAETPEGGKDASGLLPNYAPHLGTKVPELEGLNFRFYGWEILGDELLFINASGASGEGNFGNGNRWARINLRQLSDLYATDGPQRVNRQSPQWVTINNASGMWEQMSSWTSKSNNLDLKWRDGGTPLMFSPLKRACVPKAGPLADKLVFAQSVWSGDLSPIDNYYGLDSEQDATVVSVLEPTGTAFEIDVSLSFEGRALKGYASAYSLDPASAPEEVQLG